MALTGKPRNEDFARICRALPFFAGVGDEAIDALAAIAICRDYPKNNILSYGGDPASTVFLVVAGRVKISLTNEEGREVIVSLLGPGGIFGLTSALDGGDQLGDAVTVERSRIARFPREHFNPWVEAHPDVQRALVRELNRRIRNLHHKIGEHALLSAKDRLLFTLLEIAEDEGEEAPGGTEITFTRPTHQELAHRIGSSREVVSRLLAELLDSELLQADEGRVIRVPHSALVLRED